ncbi:hypothetical protein HMPREF9465_00064 [Sutterella wadsworthensis 2_1_59BFAA]|uniref:FAD-dependent oxidoreductase 2 FAD-binding domain-containing protein n=1 Tax=Sutterella wadsworthensis 2_1_59BFAA TaxID=742823 RepID=K1JQ82_9BURK|nr:FAD-dependent oxidoreductase [Sutterella wadsworthensis]EKB32381.1 hypothetical protein HMPREF9465_00064 [Sutterella wadsworthensis 2_1_59BFAA]
MTQFTVSRRAVLGGAASALLVPAAAHATTPARHYDEMTDVLIVGSGFAGMAAALAAAEKGVKVKVIEKMAFLGGNSSLSGGMMAVPGSSVQKAQGIEDSPEKLIADMTRIGQGLGNPELIRFVCEKASETFEWTRTSMGVEWNTHLTGKGGHSAARCMVTKQGTGQGILVPCSSKLKAMGVPLCTRTLLEKIFREEDGRVTGVQVREGWTFNKPESGTVKTIGVTRGECQDFCVWGGYSRGSPTRLPFVFEMQYARPDAIAGAKVEGPARSAGGSSLAPAIARREAAGALAREV